MYRLRNKNISKMLYQGVPDDLNNLRFRKHFFFLPSYSGSTQTNNNKKSTSKENVFGGPLNK